MKQIGKIAVLLCLGLAACTVQPEDIRLDAVNGVTMDGVTLSQARLTLSLTVANDSRAKVAVREGEFTVSDARGQIAELSLDDEIVLRRHSATTLDLPLVFRFSGPLGTATALPRLGADPEKLLIDGTLRLRGGMVSRTLTIDRMPLPEFLKTLGVDDLKSIEWPL